MGRNYALPAAQIDFLESWLPRYINCQSFGGFYDLWRDLPLAFHAKFPVVPTQKELKKAKNNRAVAIANSKAKMLKYMRGYYANRTRTGGTNRGGRKLLLKICRVNGKKKKRTRVPHAWQTYSTLINFRTNNEVKAEFKAAYTAYRDTLAEGATAVKEITFRGRWLADRLSKESEDVRAQVESLRHKKSAHRSTGEDSDSDSDSDNHEDDIEGEAAEQPPETRWSFCVFACGPEPKYGSVPRSYSYANGGTSTLDNVFNAQENEWKTFQAVWDKWSTERYPNGWSGVHAAVAKYTASGMTRQEALEKLSPVTDDAEKDKPRKKTRKGRGKTKSCDNGSSMPGHGSESESELEPTPSPAPEPASSPAPEPAPSASPEPAPSPAPEPAPSASPKPAPSASPEPAPSPAPEPAPSPAPEPAPSAAPRFDGFDPPPFDLLNPPPFDDLNPPPFDDLNPPPFDRFDPLPFAAPEPVPFEIAVPVPFGAPDSMPPEVSEPSAPPSD
ncbi:hypothetical protein PUNSTDRAFT_48142, partial [Punctularia strigosozonata HHB-11173 SS5]